MHYHIIRAAVLVVILGTAASAQQSSQLEAQCLAAYRANQAVPSGTTPEQLERMPRLVQVFQTCQQAAGMGSQEAKKGLGILYFLGIGVKRNKPEAVRYLTPFTHSDRQVTYYMAELNEQGFIGGRVDRATSRSLFLESCQKAYPNACHALGMIYEFGQGVPRDRQTAILYLSHAGNIGDTLSGQEARILGQPGTPAFASEEALGEYVGNKIGPDVLAGNEPDSRIPTASPGAKLPLPSHNLQISPNPQNAEQLWQACRQKYLNLDHAGAAEMCLRAAQAGSSIAMYQLGYDYENGDGVPKDINRAVAWWQKGAEYGNSRAEKALGNAYELGTGGLPQDWVTAVSWWQKSAAQGLAGAEFQLARAYRFGIGVPCNLQTAVEWYEKSAQHLGAGAEQAQWLRGNRFKFDGQFIDEQEANIFHGVWQGNMTVPFGRAFKNRDERLAYLRGASQNEREINSEGARLMYNQKKHNWDACVQQSGRDACGAPPVNVNQ
jgi:TPR repeat protein